MQVQFQIRDDAACQRIVENLNLNLLNQPQCSEELQKILNAIQIPPFNGDPTSFVVVNEPKSFAPGIERLYDAARSKYVELVRHPTLISQKPNVYNTLSKSILAETLQGSASIGEDDDGSTLIASFIQVDDAAQTTPALDWFATETPSDRQLETLKESIQTIFAELNRNGITHGDMRLASLYIHETLPFAEPQLSDYFGKPFDSKFLELRKKELMGGKSSPSTPRGQFTFKLSNFNQSSTLKFAPELDYLSLLLDFQSNIPDEKTRDSMTGFLKSADTINSIFTTDPQSKSKEFVARVVQTVTLPYDLAKVVEKMKLRYCHSTGVRCITASDSYHCDQKSDTEIIDHSAGNRRITIRNNIDGGRRNRVGTCTLLSKLIADAKPVTPHNRYNDAGGVDRVEFMRLDGVGDGEGIVVTKNSFDSITTNNNNNNNNQKSKDSPPRSMVNAYSQAREQTAAGGDDITITVVPIYMDVMSDRPASGGETIYEIERWSRGMSSRRNPTLSDIQNIVPPYRAMDNLRKAEEEARRKAEEARRKAEEEDRRKAAEEARRKAEEEARRKAEEEAEAQRKESEKAEARRKESEEAEARRKEAEESEESEEAEARRKEAEESEEAEASRKFSNCTDTIDSLTLDPFSVTDDIIFMFNYDPLNSKKARCFNRKSLMTQVGEHPLKTNHPLNEYESINSRQKKKWEDERKNVYNITIDMGTMLLDDAGWELLRNRQNVYFWVKLIGDVQKLVTGDSNASLSVSKELSLYTLILADKDGTPEVERIPRVTNPKRNDESFNAIDFKWPTPCTSLWRFPTFGDSLVITFEFPSAGARNRRTFNKGTFPSKVTMRGPSNSVGGLFTKTFEFSDTVRSGSFGTVARYVDGSDTIMLKGGEIADDVRVMKIMDGNSECAVIESFLATGDYSNVEQRQQFLVMESFVGDLDMLIEKTLVEDMVKASPKIIHSLAKSLKCLLDSELVYTDLKAGNILVRCTATQKLEVVLGDLGSICNFKDKENSCTYTTIPPDRDPRQLTGFGDEDLVWMLGIIFAQMIGKSKDIETWTYETAASDVKKVVNSWRSEWENNSNLTLLVRMLHPERRQRPTLDEVIEELRDSTWGEFAMASLGTGIVAVGGGLIKLAGALWNAGAAAMAPRKSESSAIDWVKSNFLVPKGRSGKIGRGGDVLTNKQDYINVLEKVGVSDSDDIKTLLTNFQSALKTNVKNPNTYDVSRVIFPKLMTGSWENRLWLQMEDSKNIFIQLSSNLKRLEVKSDSATAIDKYAKAAILFYAAEHAATTVGNNSLKINWQGTETTFNDLLSGDTPKPSAAAAAVAVPSASAAVAVASTSNIGCPTSLVRKVSATRYILTEADSRKDMLALTVKRIPKVTVESNRKTAKGNTFQNFTDTPALQVVKIESLADRKDKGRLFEQFGFLLLLLHALDDQRINLGVALYNSKDETQVPTSPKFTLGKKFSIPTMDEFFSYILGTVALADKYEQLSIDVDGKSKVTKLKFGGVDAIKKPDEAWVLNLGKNHQERKKTLTILMGRMAQQQHTGLECK